MASGDVSPGSNFLGQLASTTESFPSGSQPQVHDGKVEQEIQKSEEAKEEHKNCLPESEAQTAESGQTNKLGRLHLDSDLAVDPTANPSTLHRKASPADFELLKVIGIGAFGKVIQVSTTNSFFARHLVTGLHETNICFVLSNQMHSSEKMDALGNPRGDAACSIVGCVVIGSLALLHASDIQTLTSCGTATKRHEIFPPLYRFCISYQGWSRKSCMYIYRSSFDEMSILSTPASTTVEIKR